MLRIIIIFKSIIICASLLFIASCGNDANPDSGIECVHNSISGLHQKICRHKWSEVTSYIESMDNKNFYIELLINDGNKAIVLLRNQTGSNVRQVWLGTSDWDDIKSFLNNWGSYYSITNLSFDTHYSFYYVSMLRNSTRQYQTVYRGSDYYSLGRYITSQLNAGYSIVRWLIDASKWIVVFKKYTPYTSQEWRRYSNWTSVRNFYVQKWNEDFKITELYFDGYNYIIVMSKGVTGEQSVTRKASWGSLVEFIKEKFSSGYQVQRLTFDGTYWICLMSKI